MRRRSPQGTTRSLEGGLHAAMRSRRHRAARFRQVREEALRGLGLTSSGILAVPPGSIAERAVLLVLRALVLQQPPTRHRRECPQRLAPHAAVQHVDPPLAARRAQPRAVLRRAKELHDQLAGIDDEGSHRPDLPHHAH
jgi:hypothetical protein